ncbi:unnamed protein product [marine sediment metagenome]|uniref:Uncharacterized protein n=1 Tax=marine sediment metagenome TaxID=412755 RepID=X1GV91_9ZZZZ
MVNPPEHHKNIHTVNNPPIQKRLQNMQYANTPKNIVALPSQVV